MYCATVSSLTVLAGLATGHGLEIDMILLHGQEVNVTAIVICNTGWSGTQAVLDTTTVSVHSYLYEQPCIETDPLRVGQL
jgi:hypothetical protein